MGAVAAARLEAVVAVEASRNVLWSLPSASRFRTLWAPSAPDLRALLLLVATAPLPALPLQSTWPPTAVVVAVPAVTAEPLLVVRPTSPDPRAARPLAAQPLVVAELRRTLSEPRATPPAVAVPALPAEPAVMVPQVVSPSRTPDMPSSPHDSIEQAALAGMDSCKKTPREYECGFGIYKAADGKFYHTDVQSGGKTGIEGMALRIPKTSTLVAFGHTHPKTDHVSLDADMSNAFSKEDLRYAKKTGLDMFLGSEKTGQVVHYKDGVTKADKHSSLGRISYGTPIGPYGLEPPAPPPTRREALEAAYDLHTPPAKP